MKKIRFGIVGCGQISQVGHIPNLLQIDEAEIMAVSDINMENLEKAGKLVPGAEKFSDFSKMLSKSKADAVIIASPNWLHCEQTIAALEAGKHVFCEKPSGITLDQGEKIRQAWKKSGKTLQIGHELRHAKVFETAKEKIKEGLIGNIKMIRYSEFRKPLLPGWRQTGETGGVMLEKNSHFFDLFNWFADSSPQRVYSSGSNDVNKESPLIDNCFVTVEYENGVRASLTMCLFCEHGGENTFELVGEKGFLRIKNESLQIFIRETGEKLEMDSSLGNPEGMHMGCRRQLEHFMNCIRLGKYPLNNMDTTIQTLKLSLAAEESVKAGTIINVQNEDYLKKNISDNLRVVLGMEYKVKKIARDFSVDGNPAKSEWEEALELKISNWPWHDYAKYPVPEVSVKCLYSEKGIYVLFNVRERFILAKYTEYQGPAWKDSCVEFFAAPDKAGYFNFEINCIGNLLLHWNKQGEKVLVPAEDITDLKIKSSLGNAAIEKALPCPNEGYAVECFFPFTIFMKYSNVELPVSGKSWKANFYKCGDETPEPSWGSWSLVSKPKPSFHHPEYFGKIIFE